VQEMISAQKTPLLRAAEIDWLVWRGRDGASKA
jgi:hypothetical protein